MWMMPVSDAVEAAATSYADRIAVIDDDGMHDYATFDEAIGLLSEELAAEGITAGARVAVYIGRGYDALLALLAIQRLGAVVIPLDIFEERQTSRRALTATRADYLLGHVRDEHIAEDLAECFDPRDLDTWSVAGDYTLIRLTYGRDSDSTGVQGGFAFCLLDGTGSLTVAADALTAAAHETREEWGTGTEDVVAVTLPLTTCAVLTSTFATLFSGACLSMRGYPHPSGAGIAAQVAADDVSLLVCSDQGFAGFDEHRARYAPNHEHIRIRTMVQDNTAPDTTPVSVRLLALNSTDRADVDAESRARYCCAAKARQPARSCGHGV